MDKELITKAFIKEILTGTRTAKLQKLLDNSNEKAVEQAYATALKELSLQRFMLGELHALQFITVDSDNNSDFTQNSLPLETIKRLSQELTAMSDELKIEKQAFFFVKVIGNSMINSNIHHGDIIIATKATNASHNDIIVAQIGNYCYVKRYKIIDNKQWLFSENELFPPVLVENNENFNIIGNVRSLIKQIDSN